jgi:hypothetical protein
MSQSNGFAVKLTIPNDVTNAPETWDDDVEAKIAHTADSSDNTEWNIIKFGYEENGQHCPRADS